MAEDSFVGFVERLGKLLPLDDSLSPRAQRVTSKRAATVQDRLIAVLCNPPLGEPEQTTSWRNIGVLTSILGFQRFAIVNIIEQPTKSTADLADLAGKLDLIEVELKMENASRSAAGVLVGWGACAPAGWRLQQWRSLVTAATKGLVAGGHRRVVHVSDVPRHPSRWRQHTSPVHGRYSGSSFEQRLGSALRWSEVENL